RQGQRRLGLVRTRAVLTHEKRANPVPADLVEFVDGSKRAFDVLEPDSLVETLAHFAVVDRDSHRRHPDRPEFLEGRGDDDRHVRFVVERKFPVGDDVDISLEELAEATILGAFATPDLLDLVALEREVQLARILNHVTGKRNSEIEVEPEGVGLWFL